MSCKRTETLHGFEVESWYNESRCNWEAWILGIGNSSDPENRENAIVSILRKAWREKQEWEESQIDPMIKQGTNDSWPLNL